MADHQLSDVEISPNGRYLASIWHREEDKARFLTVQDLSKPNYPQILFEGETVIRPRWIVWANDERLLVALSVPIDLRKAHRDEERKEDFDIADYPTMSRTVSMDPDGSNKVILMQGGDNNFIIKRNTNLSRIHNFLPDDPDHILMTAFRISGRTIYKVNIYSGKQENIATGSSRTMSYVSSRRGDLKYRLDYLHVAKAIDIYEHTEDNNWEKLDRIYLDRGDEEDIEWENLVGTFGATDQLLYRKRNVDTGYYELVLHNRYTNEQSAFVSLPDRDVISPIIGNRTNEVVGYRIEKGDVIRHKYFDDARQKTYESVLAHAGREGFSFYSIAEEGDYGVIKTFGQDNPGAYYLYNFKTDEFKLISYSSKNLTPENLGTPLVSTYLARDNTPIRAFGLLPTNYVENKLSPLVILPHGGPQSRDYAYFDRFAQFLATRGYLVYRPNFRGSTGYGKSFEEAGYKEWGGLMQEDLEDAVAFLVRKGFVDPDRVCIVGGSYGGYAALMGTIKTPDLYRCAVSISGVTDLRKQIRYDERRFKEFQYLIDKLHSSMGHPKEDIEMLEERSPALNAEKVGAPLLIIAGKDDDVVPFKQSLQMVRALRRADKPHEFIKIDDAGHNIFYHRDHREEVYKAVEGFLATHLN